MDKKLKISALVLRVATGWLFLYAGLTKVLDPEWSAEGFLTNADNFSALYEWFALPGNIGWVNFLNQWGLTLIGIALIFGVFVRYASLAGIVMMVLYYLPDLNFPYVGEHSFLVDDHIIYALVLWVLAEMKAGEFWGLDGKLDFGGSDEEGVVED